MVTMVNGGTEDREGRGVAEWDAQWRVPREQAPQVAVAGGRGGQRLVGVVRGWPHRAMGGPGAGRPLPLCGAPTKGGRSRSGGSRRLAGGRSENLPSTRGGPPTGAPTWTVRRDWWKVRCHHTSSASKVSPDHFVVFSRHPTTSLRLRTSHPPGTVPSPSQALHSRLSSHPPPPNPVPVCLALSAPSALQTAAVAGWYAAWPLSPPLPPPASSGGGSPKDVPRAPPAPRPGR